MMPDSNAFAERQHSASQARAEERHEAYGEQVITSLVEKLFDGGKVCGLTVHDFTSFVTEEDLGRALLSRNEDDRKTWFAWFKGKTEQAIREWCAGPGADEVSELCASWEEDDRANARHMAEEAI